MKFIITIRTRDGERIYYNHYSLTANSLQEAEESAKADLGEYSSCEFIEEVWSVKEATNEELETLEKFAIV